MADRPYKVDDRVSFAASWDNLLEGIPANDIAALTPHIEHNCFQVSDIMENGTIEFSVVLAPGNMHFFYAWPSELRRVDDEES